MMKHEHGGLRPLSKQRTLAKETRDFVCVLLASKVRRQSIYDYQAGKIGCRDCQYVGG
jgi:hypothetical protein